MSNSVPDFVRLCLAHAVITTDGTVEGTHVDVTKTSAGSAPVALGGVLAVEWPGGSAEVPESVAAAREEGSLITIKMRGIVRTVPRQDGA